MATAKGVVSSITRFGRNEPWNLQIGRGQITMHEQINIFGYQGAVSSTYVPAWEVLGVYTYPASAVIMTVTSTSASDTAVSVLIRGLDANYNRITETVALNGTASILTTQAFLRINGLIATVGNAVGTITVKNSTVTYGQIAIGVGQSNMSIYTVPKGYTMYVEQTDAWSSTSVTSGVFATFRNQYTDPIGVQRVATQAPFLTNLNIVRTYPISYPETSDVQFQFRSSGAGLAIGCLVEGLLIKDDSQD